MADDKPADIGDAALGPGISAVGVEDCAVGKRLKLHVLGASAAVELTPEMAAHIGRLLCGDSAEAVDKPVGEREARRNRAFALAFEPLSAEDRAWLATKPGIEEKIKRIPMYAAAASPASGAQAEIIICQLQRIIELLERNL